MKTTALPRKARQEVSAGFALYVHVPFCLRRCPYCAFYSGEPLTSLAAYPRWVEAEIDLRSHLNGPHGAPGTVYFGGGTPSLLTPAGIDRILSATSRVWGIQPGAEVTVEVNPAAQAVVEAFRSVGVTRLSIGAQCLDDHILKALGRSHTAKEARRTVGDAVRRGFSSVSVDLLYGVPGLRPAALTRWVRELADRGVTHISAYSLEIHPGTPLAEQGVRAAEPEEEEAQWLGLREQLDALGLAIYEVSNFARPGAICRHNLSYWQRTPYLGLGPGAHSFDPRRGAWGERFWNLPTLRAYEESLRLGALPPGGRERLGRTQALLETLFLRLRRAAAVDAPFLEASFSLIPGSVANAFQSLAEGGYAQKGPEGTWLPTSEGLRRADGLALWVFDRVAAAGSGPSVQEVEVP